MLDIVGKRYWYFLLSLIIIIPGTIVLITSGLQLGVDFTGGTEFTVQMPQQNQSNQISTLFSNFTGSVSYVQPVLGQTCPGKCQYIIRTKEVPQKQVNAVTSQLQKQYKQGHHSEPPVGERHDRFADDSPGHHRGRSGGAGDPRLHQFRLPPLAQSVPLRRRGADCDAPRRAGGARHLRHPGQDRSTSRSTRPSSPPC